MNSLKLTILAATFSIFVISCSQTPPATNTANMQTNRTSTNVTVNSNGSSNGPGIALRNRSAQSAEVSEVDDAIVDLYAQKCMICHKDNGKGGRMTIEGKTINPDDLTSAKIQAKSDEKLLAVIREGVPDEGMPAFKDKLTDDQIKTIIQKIRKF